MFPDPTVRWTPYPSVIDGLRPPPYVYSRGIWCGLLYLIIVEAPPVMRAYKVEIKVEIFAAYDEMIYSITNHGDRSSHYDGAVYIKEAVTSELLETWREADPFKRTVRHFLFVGADHCYEVLSSSEPNVSAFPDAEAAYVWNPPWSQ